MKINFFNKKGFTLIELLVVIVIIGILSALLMANISGIRERARDTERKTDLRAIKTALSLYYTIERSYPLSDSENKIVACGEPPASCSWGELWNRGETVYLKILPQDPLESQTYYYYYDSTSPDNFILKATLENLSDKDISASQIKCGTGSGSEYVVCQD